MPRWVYRLRGFYPGWPNGVTLTHEQIVMLRVIGLVWMALCFLGLAIAHGSAQTTYGLGAFVLLFIIVFTWRLRGEKK